MYSNNFLGVGGFSGFSFAGFGIFILLLLVWSVVWKGFALWQSAKRSEKWWFIIFLFVNTAGILEIIYLFWISKAGIPGISSPSTKTEEKS
jgi:hypothetical protein